RRSSDLPAAGVAGLMDGQQFEEGEAGSVTWTPTDATSGVASTLVTLDGNPVTTQPLVPGDLEPGDHTLSLVVTDVAGNATTIDLDFSVAASDPVAEPDAAVSPTELSFGGVTVGEQSSAQVVTVASIGDADLHVTSVTASGPFSVDASDCTGAAVAPDDECEISVTFTPVAAGAATGSVTITSDAAGSPHEVALSGTGVDETETPAPPVIEPVNPARYWDTRDEPTFDGLHTNTGRQPAGTSYAIQIAGRGGVPADATSVVANLTAILPGGPGH